MFGISTPIRVRSVRCASTSLTAIATHAGVARETVYKLFGTKADLLKRLYDETVAGDAEDVPVERRDWWHQMLRADPATLVASFARANAEVGDRLTPMLAMISAGAAAGDAELSELSATGDAERMTSVRRMIDALNAKSALRADLTPDDATDLTWALASPEMGLLLTQRRNWSAGRYTAWLESSLSASLLA